MKISYFSFIGLICYLFILRSEIINTGLIIRNKSGYRLEAIDTIPGRPLYVDIYTGDSLDLWYDSVKFVTINRKTNMPVDFYINTVTWDTVYGRGKFVANNLIIKDEHGKYKLDESKVKIDGDELKIKDGLRKLKIDGDDFKIKNGDTKMKYDEKDKEAKIKMDSTKIKADDNQVKLKSGDTKIKTKENKTKSKVGNKKDKTKDGKTKVKEE